MNTVNRFWRRATEDDPNQLSLFPEETAVLPEVEPIAEEAESAPPSVTVTWIQTPGIPHKGEGIIRSRGKEYRYLGMTDTQADALELYAKNGWNGKLWQLVKQWEDSGTIEQISP